MALPQLDLATAAAPGGVATPAHSLTVLALNFYGLLIFFAAQVWWLAHEAPRPDGTGLADADADRPAPRREPATASTVLDAPLAGRPS
jgi:hypothetical protein